MSLRARLSAVLPFSHDELVALIHSAPFAYKTYKIRKNNGKWREVSQPTPAVKLMQRFVITQELASLPVHPAATAYRSNIGLTENVKPHLRNRFLLKMDFRDFFPSLRPADLESVLRCNEEKNALPYSEQDYRDLTRVLFKASPDETNLRLAIGAPSSPHLSNALLYDLDLQIQEVCDKSGITYTRYADDLSFSTSVPDVLNNHETAIFELLAGQKTLALEINKEKTTHSSLKNGRRITGLTISNVGELSIGRNRKRQLRAEVHAYQNGKMSADEHESLRGYLSFLNSVEPKAIESLKQKYGEALIDTLIFRSNLAKAA